MNNILLFLNIGTPEFIFVLFIIIPLGLMVYCLLDIIRSNFKDPTTKVIWLLVVLFAALLGSLIYLLLGKSQKSLSNY